jgi:serine/threonine protein kinase
LVIKDFKQGLQIGAGAFAVVKRSVHNQTRYTVAIKTYEKKNLTDKEAAEAVHREINTLSDLYHPNIMTLFEVVD